MAHKDATYFSKFDTDKFVSDFSKICWDEDKNISTDVNMKFSIFHEKVTDCVRSHVPLRNQSSDILQHSQNRPTGDSWLKI